MVTYHAYRRGHCASMYAAHVMNDAACMSSAPSSKLRGYGHVPRLQAWALCEHTQIHARTQIHAIVMLHVYAQRHVLGAGVCALKARREECVPAPLAVLGSASHTFLRHVPP